MPKTILITGCSSGFGFDAAKRFADLGWQVFATMREYEGRNAPAADALSDYADEHDLQIDVLELDVTDDLSVRDAVDGLPPLDVVINNAGYGYVGIVESFSSKQILAQFDLNLVGPARVAKAVLPAMRARGKGLIIQVSSIAGRLSLPGNGVYCASKWALEALSESMRYELGPLGIDVCIVEPGPFSTDFLANIQGGSAHDDMGMAYPHVAEYIDGFVQNVQQAFAASDAPTDPSAVVDRFVELADMKPGTRPLRSVVGLGFGTEELNAAIEPHRTGMLEAQGIGEWDGARG